MNTPRSVSYSDSGVDIDAGNALVERIKPLAKTTARSGADAALGGFGALFDLSKTGYKDPILVAATDGVGTKLKLAFAMDKHDTVGIDLVAMCVNDLVVQGAEPLFFLDYFATGKLEIEQAGDVVRGIAEGCRQAGCALIGGETAEMPGMYQKGDYDLAGFAVGVVERSGILPSQDIAEEDVIVGLPSSGVHSNGFSLVRKIMELHNLSLSDAPFSEQPLGDVLLTPTAIYVKACLEIAQAGYIKAMAHITGGGITENLPRVLPDNLCAGIDLSTWQMPAVFHWLKAAGNVHPQEMLKTFNCGIGMALVVDKAHTDNVISITRQHGYPARVIGKIVQRNDNPRVTYTNADGFFQS